MQSLQALSPLVAGWGPFSGVVEPPVEGVFVPSDPMNSLLSTLCTSSHFYTVEKLLNCLSPLRDQSI
jgi:hypothetical protein